MELDGSSSTCKETKQSVRLQVVDSFKTGPNKLELITCLIADKSAECNGKPSDSKKVILEGVWTQNHIPRRCIIHLLDPLYDARDDTFIVNNANGLIVVEPDSLLTCTNVASSLFCERKTWLNNVFLGQVGTNRAMLVGTLVHEVFQHAVRHKIADLDKLVQHLDGLLDDATVMLEIYSVELHIDDVRNEAISYLSSVKEWIEKFMLAGPRYALTNDANLEVKVTKVCDIEENVWSTKYGLKGKIDVTGMVRVYDKRSKKLDDKIIPLELKTGNPNLSPSHAAQVSLYSMMIEDRYAETNRGFVIYLKNNAAMHNVQLAHNIKRDLVQRRNQINYHMKNFMVGPPMIDQTRMCQNCERLTECVLMSNMYQPNEIESYPVMKSLELDAVGHLDKKFIEFFQKYHERLVKLMTAGEQTNQRKNSFWTYSSKEAENRGTGFGKLQATVRKDLTQATCVTFRRHPDHSQDTETHRSGNSISPVTITIDDDHEAEPKAAKKQKIADYFKPVQKGSESVASKASNATPFNTDLDFSRCRIAISLDKDEQNLDSQNSSTAIAIGFLNELKPDYLTIKLYEGTLDLLQKEDLVFRVDKLEKRSPLDIERVVLVRLLERDNWRADRVRQLILDADFKQKQNAELNLFVISTSFDQITELEESHQKFIVEAVSTDNFYILDEKVETSKDNIHKIVSCLARVIVHLERTILIVAPNVDQLVGLMKILQHKKAKFILLDDGKSTKARFQFPNNLVKVLQLETLSLKMKFNAYIRQHELAPIVITSYAMSVGGLLFTRRTFDYCVAYECDTTELLLSLSPMFCSDRYVLIDIQGDSAVSRSGDDNAAAAAAATRDDKEEDEASISLGNHLRRMRKQQQQQLCDI